MPQILATDSAGKRRRGRWEPAVAVAVLLANGAACALEHVQRRSAVGSEFADEPSEVFVGEEARPTKARVEIEPQPAHRAQHVPAAREGGTIPLLLAWRQPGGVAHQCPRV